MLAVTGGPDWTLLGYIALVAATLAAAFVGAWATLVGNRQLKTNHGKTIGQHVEDASEAAQAANINAQLVALQLEQYKRDQAEAARIEHELLEGYVRDDRAAHEELRKQLLLIALGKDPGVPLN
jgi:hypothetical protein